MTTQSDERRQAQTGKGQTEGDQESVGQSGQLGAHELQDEHDTPDDKERAIEHGAEQYYRENAPDDGPLNPGDKPESPGKVQPGRSAT